MLDFTDQLDSRGEEHRGGHQMATTHECDVGLTWKVMPSERVEPFGNVPGCRSTIGDSRRDTLKRSPINLVHSYLDGSEDLF